MTSLKWNMYYFTILKENPIDPYSVEYMVSANIERTLQATRQAVADLRALIKWIKANKRGP